MPRGRRNVAEASVNHTEDLLLSWRRERPDLDMTEFLLGIAVMRIGRLLEQNFNRNCRLDFSISGPDMRVLFALRRAGPPFTRRPTDLFRALLVTSGAMTKQIDRLEDAGLVKRLPDPDYGGGFLIRLTKGGRAVADRATEDLATESLLGKALVNFSQAERNAIESLLMRLLEETENNFKAVTEGAPAQ